MTDKEKYLKLNVPEPEVIVSEEVTEEEKKKKDFLKFINEMKKHPK